jgi:hypothetical protein
MEPAAAEQEDLLTISGYRHEPLGERAVRSTLMTFQTDDIPDNWVVNTDGFKQEDH